MITRIGMAPRRPGSTVREFQEHWRTAHADAALRIPALRAYVQNHAVLDEHDRPVLPYPGFDACAETSFDALDSMDAGFASREYQQDVRADEAVLIDKTRFFLLLCERQPVFDASPPEDAIKLMTFHRVHPLSSRAALLETAHGAYAEAVRASGALRHELLVPLPEAHEGRQPAHCELVDAVTFADAAAALDFLAGPALDAVWGGVVFGRERLLARPRIVKHLEGRD